MNPAGPRAEPVAGIAPSESDFVAVQSFDATSWSCSFTSSSEVKPTSDTPLHWAAIMTAEKILGWSERPVVSLHGHALAEKAGLEIAEKLQLPISHEETLFSTPEAWAISQKHNMFGEVFGKKTQEDVDALMTLFKSYPYPEHKVFIRRGHGFLILAESLESAMKELKKLVPHFEEKR
eukprot:symbB.v1.2.021398.t1/scaffold1845.1/size99025/2